tara:strand:- start:3068 stop:3355 length:288 start_codon:yes stop_codon:yes gene_type:complete
MKIYDKRTFICRLLINVSVLSLVVAPFALGRALATRNGMVLIEGIIALIFLETMCLWGVMVIFYAIKKLLEIKIFNRWWRWATTEDMADKFIEKI